jgi:hypothetical protein
MNRRCEKENLELRAYLDALRVLKELIEERDSFDKRIQKRLRKIEKNWEHFTHGIHSTSWKVLRLRAICSRITIRRA